MYDDSDRRQSRQFFFDTWQKYQSKQALGPLEQQLLQIILQHPEYHFIFSQPEKYLEYEYLPELGETNPFLHMALHLSVLEQVSTNRPEGIREIYHALCKKSGSSLEAEHQMMGCIVESLWQAQRSGQMPNEANYLNQLRKLVKKK